VSEFERTFKTSRFKGVKVPVTIPIRVNISPSHCYDVLLVSYMDNNSIISV
jgi:hypothetical protein